MARPLREDAEWFPFLAKDGRTLTIMQQRFQLTGIGFFTNLMRVLCTTPQHHLNLNDEVDREYAYAKLGCDAASAERMIAVMVMTGKLDRKLWESAKVIFCADLAESLAPIYKDRTTDPPTAKQLQKVYIRVSPPETADTSRETGVDRAENPTQTDRQTDRETDRQTERVKPELETLQSWLERTVPEMPRVKNPGGFIRDVLKNPGDRKYVELMTAYHADGPGGAARDPPAAGVDPPGPTHCDACGSARVSTGGPAGTAMCRDCQRYYVLIEGQWVPDPQSGRGHEGPGSQSYADTG